jgi:hypothetical protein
MSDIAIRILIDLGVLAVIAALLKHFIKKWIEGALDLKFKSLLEDKKALLEIEKTKGLEWLKGQNAVFPEIVELVYRLRNDFRDKILTIDKIIAAGIPSDKHDRIWGPSGFGQELYILRENLYKYRVFFDEEEVFEKLHRFKRICQDAEVLLDRISRPDHSATTQRQNEVELERCYESADKLRELFSEIDALYPDITNAVKDRMKSIIERK